MGAPHADGDAARAPGRPTGLLATLFDIADDAVVVVDEASTIVLFNQGAERIFGYPSATAVGAPLALLMPPEAAAVHPARIAAFARAGGGARRMGDRGGLRGRRADGSVFPAEASIAQVVVGGATYYAAILRDISARERSDAALAASEARFRALAEAAPVGIVEADAQGRCRYVNQRWCALAGLEASAALGDGWQRALHPEDAAVVARDWEAAIDAGGAYAAELRFVHADGREVWVHANAVPGPGSGQAGRVGTFTDITERRRHEAMLEQAKREAEAAAAAKSLFLANMSHEIRTPLNAVIGMTSLLLATPMSDEQKEMARTIRASGAALLDVLNDVLDYSKAEAGRLALEQRPFALRDAIEGALDQVAPDAAAKALDLAYLVAPGVAARVAGDEARLRQVLVNLLANAVKFTPRGEVLLTVAAEPLGPRRQRLHFAVRDTGIGIPRERLPHLFQSFMQVDPSTTRKYGGTGLGLAISKRLAELMGGTAWAESEPGVGSTFHVTIAAGVEAVDDPGEAAREAVAARLAGRRALVVAPHAATRRVLVRSMQGWGLHTHAHASAAEALDHLRGGAAFDVAVLDVDADDPDAPALGRALRRVGASAAGAVVLVAAPGARPGATLAGGVRGVRLGKPVKPAALLDALDRACSDGRAGTAAPAPPGPAGGALRVLVAEDNVVNQRVALRMLAHLGHRAEVADTGAAVLAALDREAFDVVLMDVQMPELDGIETTRRIRQRAAAGAGPRIVAMTANALPEHRELCLAAGMDAYLAKPIELDDLRDALRGVMTEVPRRGQPSLDAARLVHLAAMADPGSDDFVGGLIDLLFVDAPQRIGELHDAWSRRDAARLRRVAHRLRSGAGNLGAARLEALCEAVERIDEPHLVAEGAVLLDGIEREYAVVRAMLEGERARRAAQARTGGASVAAAGAVR